jgi:hypothetical protein
MSEFDVVIQCSGTLLTFSPCSTFHLSSSLLNVSPPLQPPFTRRTSEHWLGTFVVINFSFVSQLKAVSVATLTQILFSLSLSLFSSASNG